MDRDVAVMQLTFLAVAGFGLLYLLSAYRRCDTFTLAFVSSCVYFLPGFFGSVPGGFSDEPPVPLEWDTYAIMITVLSSILLGAWLWDAEGSQRLRDVPLTRDRLAVGVALTVSVVGLTWALWTDAAGLLSAYKEDVLQSMSRSFMMLGFGASLATILAFAQRQWLLLAPAVCLLMFTTYVGLRSYFAMSVIAVFLIHFQPQGLQRLNVRNFPAIVLAGGFAMTLFVYKLLYAFVKLGAYDEVLARLVDPDFYLDAVISSEPFTTQLVLNEVVRTGFETEWEYIVVSVAGQFTLFSNDAGLTLQSFNNLFQPVLFPDVDWGMANNIWAQMIAAGGWPLFLGFLFFYVWTLRVAARWMASSRVTTRAGVALMCAYWAFYIHRNDLGYELSELKRVFLIWSVVTAVSSIGWARATTRKAVATPPVRLRRAA